MKRQRRKMMLGTVELLMALLRCITPIKSGSGGWGRNLSDDAELSDWTV
jgi:hypothetical protein